MRPRAGPPATRWLQDRHAAPTRNMCVLRRGASLPPGPGAHLQLLVRVLLGVLAALALLAQLLQLGLALVQRVPAAPLLRLVLLQRGLPATDTLAVTALPRLPAPGSRRPRSGWAGMSPGTRSQRVRGSGCGFQEVAPSRHRLYSQPPRGHGGAGQRGSPWVPRDASMGRHVGEPLDGALRGTSQCRREGLLTLRYLESSSTFCSSCVSSSL